MNISAVPLKYNPTSKPLLGWGVLSPGYILLSFCGYCAHTIAVVVALACAFGIVSAVRFVRVSGLSWSRLSFLFLSCLNVSTLVLSGYRRSR